MARMKLHISGKKVTGPKAVEFATETGGKFGAARHTGWACISYPNKEAYDAASKVAKSRGYACEADADRIKRMAKIVEENKKAIEAAMIPEETLRSWATPEVRAAYAASNDQRGFVGDLMAQRGTANCYYKMFDILEGNI